MTVTVKLVRHGETVANKTDIFAGSIDVPMTDLGRKQCEMTADHLKDWKIDMAFGSPLSRSIETARYFLKNRQAPPELVIDERIIEKSFGELGGKTKTLLPGGKLTTALEAHWGVEPIEAVQERMLDFWNELFPASGAFSDKPDPLNIFISTHGALTRHFLEALRAKGYTFPSSYNPKDKYGNCSIMTIEMEYSDGKWKGTVTELGGKDHLNGMATNAVGDAVETVPDARIA